MQHHQMQHDARTHARLKHDAADVDAVSPSSSSSSRMLHHRPLQLTSLVVVALLNDGAWPVAEFVFRFISARCNIYISRLCHDASPSVRLSTVTEVHRRIIANLGFKFRSHFDAHCGGAGLLAARPIAVLLAGGSSRAMLASARSLVSCYSPV